ncbi:hypothetical protein [Actinoplanes rectilineatus]|uniref:hypothetical protein n=1 Tax=Actinoplanes rectilineatus TaxID=113571 RepID=UPI0005F2D7B0|nr:hypothetical protein [Actinoplanes rectilineatus]
MGDSITTRLGLPYAQQPETRAAAVAYLARTNNADLLEVLGLIDAEPSQFAEDGRRLCPACEKPLPGDGRAGCRRNACEVGPAARGVTR